MAEDKTIIFQYGDHTYGPYTAEEDPTAIPEDGEMRDFMTGVEIRIGDEILFRGGVLESGDSYWLHNEDGTLTDVEESFMISYGVEEEDSDSILFADELFRWNLSFQIRNVDNAEPSDTVIAGRYLSWTVLTIAALALFITGLQ